MPECTHFITIARKGQKGSWCQACGMKIYDVDERQCKDCADYRQVIGGSVCLKHLMGVTPDMHVTYLIDEGSCWRMR